MIINTKDSMHSMYPGYKQYIHVFIWMGSFTLTIHIVNVLFIPADFKWLQASKQIKSTRGCLFFLPKGPEEDAWSHQEQFLHLSNNADGNSYVC